MNYALTLISLDSFFMRITPKANRNRMIPRGFRGVSFQNCCHISSTVFGVFLWCGLFAVICPLSAENFHHHHSSSPSTAPNPSLLTASRREKALDQTTSSTNSKCLPEIPTSGMPQPRTEFGLGTFAE